MYACCEELRLRTSFAIACCVAATLIAARRHVRGAAEFMFRASVDGKCSKASRCRGTRSRCCSWAATAGCTSSIRSWRKDAAKTSPRFIGYSPAEMKAALQQEYGNRFEVSTTRHYLVVHPQGERDQWADRFEDLYNRFGHYFRVRGFTMEEPPYPLVAVVFRDQAEYFRHAAASGTPMHPNTLGHYDPLSNRVFLVRCDGRRQAAPIGRKTPRRSSTRPPTRRRTTWACTGASRPRRGGWSKAWPRCSRRPACGARNTTTRRPIA